MSDCHGWKAKGTSSDFHSSAKFLRRKIRHRLDNALKQDGNPTGAFEAPLITAICRSGKKERRKTTKSNPSAPEHDRTAYLDYHNITTQRPV